MTSIEPRRAKGWDIALSIIFGVLTIGSGIVAILFQFIEVAFTDECAAGCHPGAGIAGVFVIDAILGMVVIAAIVITVIRLIRQRRAWWIMLIAFVVVLAGSVGADFVYAAAVGYAA